MKPSLLHAGRLAALASLLGLAACASTPPVTDPASRYYELPPGTLLVVHQPIEIPAGSAHAKLQHGKVVADDALRRYEPSCELEVNDVLERTQSVAPDRFTIRRTIRQQQLVELPPPVRLAGVGVGIGVGSGGRFGWGIGIGIPIGQGDRDGGQLAFNTITLRLHSEKQPQVRELRCTAGWATSGQALYPTLAEMQAALGDLAELRRP